MKLLLLIISLSILLAACNGSTPTTDEPEPSPKDTLTEEMQDTAETTSTLPVSIDSSDTQEVPTFERLVLLAEQFYEKYEALPKKDKKYVEEVPLNAFQGEYAEMGELEIVEFGEFTHIHADYFDVAPMGGKRFMVHEGQLFGIEIVTLEEEVTEKGAQIVESVTHTFYYDEGELVTVWSNKAKGEVEGSSIPWADENLKDWETVQKHL